MSVRISQLNQLTSVTSDDFIPIVDSGSLTTFHTPISVVGNWIHDSGSVPSASWASRSVDTYGTAAFATNVRRWESFERNLATTVGNAIEMCHAASSHHMQSFLLTLQVFGNHGSCAKTYFVNNNVVVPGYKIPLGNGVGTIYSGWYTAQPFTTPGVYVTEENPYTDFDLEVSESHGSTLWFRIRTSINTQATTTPTGSLSLISLTGFTTTFTNDGGGEVVSSNTIPSWGSAFVTQEGNYKFRISGSLLVEKGMTGSLDGPSLFGTSSWAVSASFATYTPNADTASYVLQAISASFATTAKTTHGTASYALTIPNTGISAVPGIVPIGTILDFAGVSCPDPNWLMCTGSDVSRTTYAALFTVIGETWGAGDTTTTFGLPDLNRRMTLGMRSIKSSNSFISNSVGNVGGGEALNYHHHLNGFSQAGGDGYADDDFYHSIIGTTQISSSNFVPRYNALMTQRNPFWDVDGDRSSLGSFKYGGTGNITGVTTIPDEIPWIGTSFGIVDPLDWRAGDSTWNTPTDIKTQCRRILGRQDLNMPYAVTMKIIRAR
jgi:hypothetical protein